MDTGKPSAELPCILQRIGYATGTEVSTPSRIYEVKVQSRLPEVEC